MVYFYQSLLDRITEYVSNPPHKLRTSERRILANLYTAGLSKICKIRSGTEQNLIIDIESYLDVAIEHISLLEKRGKLVVLNQFKTEYRWNLESKINDNRDIIITDIVPAIAQLSSQIDTQIKALLDNVMEEKNSVASSNAQNEQMRRQLQKFVIPRSIINFVKVVANVVHLFTGFGTVVGETLNTMSRVAAPFTSSGLQIPSERNSSFTTADELKDNIYKFENSERIAIKKGSTSLLTILDDMLEIATGFSFLNILNPVKLVRKKLMDDKRVDLSSEEVDLLQNDVQNIIQKTIVEVKTQFRNETKLFDALDKITKKLLVFQWDVDMFNKVSSDDEKLYKMASAMRLTQTKLLELDHLQRGLQQSIMPMVRKMGKLLKNELPTKLTRMSSLDVFKWRIQNILKNIRNQMQQFGSVNWKLDGELSHLLDKLDGAISTLSNIFDRMQIYEDQVRLSNYIANIESTHHTLVPTSSSRESDSLNHLNLIIESNVLLAIFDNALNAFKQTVFPFADFYLRRFDLPPQLEMNSNLKTLVVNATDELRNLKLTLKEYQSASINANDNLIHTGDFSSDFASSKPFYVWAGDEHHDMIVKLLSGRNVTVKPDITKAAPKLNAVKFQYLQIQLKSSNEDNQAKLDKILKNFDVTIIHHGNSYYRCDDKFYLITSPTQRIEYSFEKDSNGHSIRSNNVYRKMRHGDFVLSPYALLTISLRPRNPQQYKDSNSDLNIRLIDLELTGRGQYLNPNVSACVGLEQYYAADEMLVNDIQPVST